MARKSRRAAKAKAPRRKATKRPNDTALINECVTYAQSVAAHRAGFDADSDGDNKHAERLGDRHSKRAHQALMKITNTPATTAEGLCSMARIAEFVFQDNEGGCFRQEAVAFLQSFSIEVKNFLRPICEGVVLLQTNAPSNGGAA